MNKIVYVKGTIVVRTPFFKYLDAGALFKEIPEGSEILEPNGEIDGSPYLIIDDNLAPSFFKGYYATGNFVHINSRIAPFFSKSIKNCYDQFESKLSEVKDLIFQNDVSPKTRQILYQLSLVASVSALDTYISDLVLFIATKDRNIFLEVAKKFCKNKSADIIARIAKMWCDNTFDSAEQDVIDCVLKTSYSNVEKINDVLKKLFSVTISLSSELDDIFTLRHLIVHRSGIHKDGSSIKLENKELLDIIDLIHNFGLEVYKNINDSDILKTLSKV